MSQSNQPFGQFRGKQARNNLILLSVGGEIGCATLAIVLLALFIGIGLSKLLGTKIFIPVLILGSAPLSLYITYWLAMRAVKNVTPQAKDTEKINPIEENGKSG